MSVYESLMRGLNEALEYEKGNLKTVRIRKVKITPVPHYHAAEIKRIREQYHASQSVFASALGVSTKTIESWESGKNLPKGPAQRMLGLMAKDKRIFDELVSLKN